MRHGEAVRRANARYRFFLALGAVLLAAPSAHAATVCAWIVESNDPGGTRLFDLWLQSDKDIQGFDLVTGGKGVVTASGSSMSPSTATYALDAGKADKAWGMGASIDGPGKIDITVELRKSSMDDIPENKLPLLAHYAFERSIPPNEKKPPTTLAKHQCQQVNL
jgi:hypothetical protein